MSFYLQNLLFMMALIASTVGVLTLTDAERGMVALVLVGMVRRESRTTCGFHVMAHRVKGTSACFQYLLYRMCLMASYAAQM